MNREEEEIVKTTKLSLVCVITKLPMPHQQWYKGVYRKEWSMYLFPLYYLKFDAPPVDSSLSFNDK